jgi:hypothetical protein
MNLEEYRNRIEQSHSITGIPSYWEQLQEMTRDRDEWRKIAEGLYNHDWHCPPVHDSIECAVNEYLKKREGNRND